MKMIADFWWKIRWSSRATAWLHVLAMFAPFNCWRIFFYRLRGTQIGRDVYIVQGCFLEESRPWLITIEDEVKISAGATIVTHDVVYHAMDPAIPYRFGEVRLKRKCIVGPRAIILPGVTVGEGALVGAGAIVVKDVPPGTVVAATPAKHLMTLADGLSQAKEKIDEYRKIDLATKYPWKVKHNRPEERLANP